MEERIKKFNKLKEFVKDKQLLKALDDKIEKLSNKKTIEK
jgi:hypothetical protein